MGEREVKGEREVFEQHEHASEEDVPAPVAAVLARRASRKVRDEPGSDSDAHESKESLPAPKISTHPSPDRTRRGGATAQREAP